MANSLGKKFEASFRENWQRCFPNTFLYRLPDQVSGYKTTSQNICDFIAYHSDKLWLLETKSHEGNSIPFSAIPQYERLLQYKNIAGVNPYIIIWFIDKEKIIAVPIEEAEKMVLDNKKSISLKMLDENIYRIINIPAVKKRVFLEADYAILTKEAK